MGEWRSPKMEWGITRETGDEGEYEEGRGEEELSVS